jgi:hypothetical protein
MHECNAQTLILPPFGPKRWDVTDQNPSDGLYYQPDGKKLFFADGRNYGPSGSAESGKFSGRLHGSG